jgi:hypothetical protein
MQGFEWQVKTEFLLVLFMVADGREVFVAGFP